MIQKCFGLTVLASFLFASAAYGSEICKSEAWFARWVTIEYINGNNENLRRAAGFYAYIGLPERIGIITEGIKNVGVSLKDPYFNIFDPSEIDRLINGYDTTTYLWCKVGKK